MANEKCPKCGSEKIAVPEGLAFPKEWICPLDPKDCRIKELERQLEEAKAASRYNKEWFVALHLDLASVLGMLHRAEGHADQPARIHELLLEVKRLVSASGAYHEATGKAESERDAALAQVGVLREALEAAKGCLNDACQAVAIYGDQPPQLYLDAIDKIQAALSATSATAQQFVERIEREALERFFSVITDPGNEIVWVRPSGRSIHADPRFIHAAILGEKEKG